MSTDGSVLSATGVGRRGRQGRWLFRDISLELPSREIVRVIGAPGSGVSTLLQLFAGVVPPSRGTIRLRAPTVGYVPQHFSENLPMTAEEYLTWVGRIRGLRSDVRQRRITELSREFELGTGGGQRLSSSTANRDQLARRLSIMQALLDEPAMLVLDDLWSANDSHLREVLAKRVLQLSAAGCLIIYSGFAPALRPTRYLSLTGGRLQVTDRDPSAQTDQHMRFELAGHGTELSGTPGVIEQHAHPDGLVVTVERAFTDEVLVRAVQSGWKVRRVEPNR